MIVVTAPTSSIGSQVLRTLVGGGEPLRVVARDPARLPAEIRDRVEVVPGSHGDPDVVGKAFDGADAVFWLPPPNPRAASLEEAYVDFARPACAVFAGGGVGRVVGISALGRGTPVAGNAGYVTGSLAMDDLIAATGVAYRALTMPSFMDNTARQAELIGTQGLFTGVVPGDRAAPTCATRDIAAVAVAQLRDRSWRGFAEVAVLGPEDLSADDMAQIMTDVLGRPVRYQRVPEEAFTARLREFGMSPAMAQGMLDMMRAKGAGLDDGVARTPENSTPTTFRQWCADVLAPAVARLGSR